MASIPGGQYSFFAAGQTVNLVTTTDGANLPPPILGDFNLELVTGASDPPAMYPGYQGMALESAGGKAITLAQGNYGVRVVGNGPDTITAGAGNDTIFGGSGPNVIYAGTGSDTIIAGSGPTTIYGGHGDPRGFDPFGGSGHGDPRGSDPFEGHWQVGNLISGGGGPDVIYGGNGDTIQGGVGPDTIYGGSHDTIQGGTGPDTIYGGTRDLISGGTGPDLIYGASHDTIQGGTGPDTIYGGSDRELITGGSGDNLIVGGSGHETIDGGAGNNTIQVGSGPTLLQDNGVTGHDTVVGFDTAHGDKIGFEGENKASIDNVVATAKEHAGNTTITLPDGSTMTLVGITHIDHTFFH